MIITAMDQVYPPGCKHCHQQNQNVTNMGHVTWPLDRMKTLLRSRIYLNQRKDSLIVFIVRMDKYTIYNLLKLLCLAFYI